MIAPQPAPNGALVADFGRGSREQSQGIRRKDNVHPIRVAEAAAEPSG
jgi:hypothetical protein